MAKVITSSLITDIAIIGGGPAGLAAAIAVRKLGLECMIIERSGQLGGQILAVNKRAPEKKVVAEITLSNHLVQEIERLRVKVIHGASIYRVDETRKLIVTNGESTKIIQFRVLLLAMGAREQVLPFPGWTLPGVITTGAAQRAIFGAGVKPGRRVLVAGSGPLMLNSAACLIKAGVQVVGVVEATPLSRLGPAALLTMLRSPTLIEKSRDSLKTLLGSKAQLRWGKVVVSVKGDKEVKGAITAGLQPGGQLDLEHQETWDIDTICVNDGLLPNLHLLRALDGALVYDMKIGAYKPMLNNTMQSSLDWVFVAGEMAGIGGAEKAAVEGEIAGTEAALSLKSDKRDEFQNRLISLNRRRRHLQRRWDELQRMFLPVHERTWQAGPGTIICRCEEIPIETLQRSIQGGDGTLRDLKLRTRLGMGFCQGRQCEHLAYRLLAKSRQISSQEIEALHIRPPLEPVSLATLAKMEDVEL